MTQQAQDMVPTTPSPNNGTTELVPYSEETEVINPTDSTGLTSLVMGVRDLNAADVPIHMQMIMLQEPDIAETLSDVYFGSDPVPFSDFIGRQVEVLGMMLFEQKGPYKGKDGYMHPGYFQVRILTSEKDRDGRYIVIKSGGAQLSMHVFNILSARGWLLFDAPVKYLFTQGKNNDHHISRVSPPALSLKKSK